MRSVASFQSLEGARCNCRVSGHLCIRLNARLRGRRWPSYHQAEFALQKKAPIFGHQTPRSYNRGVNAAASSLEGQLLYGLDQINVRKWGNIR